jgi:hypothetical protein
MTVKGFPDSIFTADGRLDFGFRELVPRKPRQLLDHLRD